MAELYLAISMYAIRKDISKPNHQKINYFYLILKIKK